MRHYERILLQKETQILTQELALQNMTKTLTSITKHQEDSRTIINQLSLEQRIYYGNYDAVDSPPLLNELFEFYGVNFKLNQSQIAFGVQDLI